MSQTQKHTDDTTGDNLKKVAVGAAVVAAGAAVVNALRDEETREKVMDAAKQAGTKAMEVAGQLRDAGSEAISKMSEAGQDWLTDLIAKFDALKAQIDSGEFAEKFEKKVAELAEKFKEAQEAGQDKTGEVAKDLETRLEKLQADVEKA